MKLKRSANGNKDNTKVTNPHDVIDYASKLIGIEPNRKYTAESYCTLRTIFEYFRSYDTHLLGRLAKYTTHGVCAVIGNDCEPHCRDTLIMPDVYDVHTHPVVFDEFGVVGIEGSIYYKRGHRYVNDIGVTKFKDIDVIAHLEKAFKKINIKPSRLIIVSHTPPRGILDVGIRFGLEKLGSPSLLEFINTYNPPLVLSGHCHSCGGKYKYIGNTLVVNGASSDTDVRKSYAAVIEVNDGQIPSLKWIDPTPYSVIFVPGIGANRASILGEAGINLTTELFTAGNEVLKSIKFGKKRSSRLRAFEAALKTNKPIKLVNKLIDIPEEIIFYDVETNLRIASDAFYMSESQEPWIIAAMLKGSGNILQWVAVEEKRKNRRAMYEEFFDFINQYPNAFLCSWSGTGFDDRAVSGGLERWRPKLLKEWYKVRQIDLLKIMRASMVFPTFDMSLKKIAYWCGFPKDLSANEIDGFEVGLSYELYHRYKEPLNLEAITQYSKSDVLMLEFILEWLKKEFEFKSIST